jgi:pimeloyl-ACP methyl ester carboxylesterase
VAAQYNEREMNILKRLLQFLFIVCFPFVSYALYARRFVRRFEDLDPKMAGAPGSFIDIDGRSIHYVQAGQGDSVVLIHGWNGSTFDLRYVIPELAQRYRVVAIDLLGYGYSARPADGDYSVAGQGELVDRMMDRLGIKRAVVLGHSMGGAIAMWLALHYPERVQRLILVDSATVKEMSRGRNWGLVLRPLLPLLAPVLLRKRIVRRGLRSAVHDPARVTPETLEGHLRLLRMKGHLRAQAKQLSDRRRDEAFDAGQVRQPTLILWGEHDRWIPLSTGEELARLIPNARLVAIRSAGHLPLEEQPALCNRELLQFLGTSAAVAPLPMSAPATIETAS